MVHVTINTRDLEGSMAFYEEVLELERVRELSTGTGHRIVFLSDSGGGTQVELIEDRENAYAGSGISIGFYTEDVKAKREELVKKGFEPTPIHSPAPDVKFFFLPDPNAVQIQLIGK